MLRHRCDFSSDMAGLCYYGDVEVAFEIEDAALYFDVLQVVTAFRAKQILLHQFFESWFVFGKFDYQNKQKKFRNNFQILR